VIPLVVLDLDGTIIGSKGHVEDCVWQVVDKARAAGMKFAACTGRPCAGVGQKVAQRLGPNNPHIFQNGAQLAYPSGEAIQVFALKEAEAKRLVEQARNWNLALELYTPTTLFVERRTPISEAHAKMIGVSAIVRDLLEVARNEPIVRAQWVVEHAQATRVLAERLPGLQYSLASAPPLPETTFISVTQAGVSKGTATSLLAEHFRVDLSEVLGVGDSLGDAPMLDAVGYPVVMGNAPEELKARYGTVAGDVDKCGVVAVIERALLETP
jgi:Cof subfamily protein (haloacid dehalogenase superfamily)